MTRRLQLSVALMVTLTTALAFGWWRSARAEERARRDELRADLSRAIDGVRAAVEESLEELRGREDQRPFYEYHHYFSPPDVLALSDPVAVSPLATRPEDPRILGHFQIDPDGTVRTPYQREGAPRTARADRVHGVLADPAFGPLRALVEQGAERNLLRSLPPARPTHGAAEEGRTIGTGTRSVATNGVRANRDREDVAAAAGSVEATNGETVGTGEVETTEADPTLEGPLALGLEQWSNAVVAEIEAAQQGSESANLRLQQRGRQMPVTRRSLLPWDSGQATGSATTQAEGQLPAREAERAPRARRVERAAPPETADELSCVLDSPDAFDCAPTPAALLDQREADVGYTPMAYRTLGEHLVLHRVVRHQGAAVVQGAILDRAHLRGVWLPALVERHGGALVAGDEVFPAVVDAGSGSCVVRLAASGLFAAQLCFAPAAVARPIASMEQESTWQLAVLLGLLALLALGAFVVVRAAGRVAELSRQKSAFVSAVSHELRTPLTTLRLHAEMLDEGLVSEGRQKKVYGELVQESVRLGQLIENVLELSKLEEGAQKLRLARADLAAHVAATVESQRAFVERRGFELVAELPPEPLHARFDAQALDLVLVNLLDNGSKYGRGERCRLEVAVVREGDAALIRVRDEGPGVPSEHRARVFERFERVIDDADGHLPGTGIGLALVRELVEAQGGRVALTDAPGGGCEIRVHLPLAG